MMSLSLRVCVGILLTGCTVNNVRISDLNFQTPTLPLLIEKEPLRFPEPVAVKPVAPVVTVQGNTHIRPECVEYVPLVPPKPIRIDFKELEAAETTSEINAIALRNLKALHKQMNDYGTQQTKHYADYRKKCVIK